MQIINYLAIYKLQLWQSLMKYYYKEPIKNCLGSFFRKKHQNSFSKFYLYTRKTTELLTFINYARNKQYRKK